MKDKSNKSNSELSREKEINNKIEELMGPPEDELKSDLNPALYKPQFKEDKSLLSGKVALTVSSAPPIKDKARELLTDEPAKDEKIEPEDNSLANQKSVDESMSEMPEESVLDDSITSKAIDEIVANESDEVLEAEDSKLNNEHELKKQSSKGNKVVNFFKSWWKNPKARKITIIAAIAALFIIFIIPITRYSVLNTFGVRASTSTTILDNSTQQPLKNVKVSVSGVSGLTDNEGKVSLKKIKLGYRELVIEKVAFAPIKNKLTIGLGSNPLGEYKLTPSGVQYTFVLSDFLSGKPISKAEASSGQASALSDKDGKVVLTVEDLDSETLEVSIKADQYREEKSTLKTDNVEQNVLKMVPARKQVFVSKRSGKYDVYKIDVDGKNEQKVLEGSGIERDDIVLVSHPTEEIAAMVSTRENVRDQYGYLLSTLTLIDLSDDSPTKVAQAEKIQIIDWIGDKLIFVQIKSGTSAIDPNRHKLISYDYKTGESKELARSNYFNDVIIVSPEVFYAPSAAYQSSDNIGMFKINADGSGKKSIINQEVWNIFRVSYDQLNLAVQQDWYEYKIGDDKASKMNSAPPSPKTKIYISSPDKKLNLWIDQRDGKGVLLSYDQSSNKDQEITKQSNLDYPIRWINDFTAIYRIDSSQESADYVVNLQGGEPKKIIDVTNTGGINKWYYY